MWDIAKKAQKGSLPQHCLSNKLISPPPQVPRVWPLCTCHWPSSVTSGPLASEREWQPLADMSSVPYFFGGCSTCKAASRRLLLGVLLIFCVVSFQGPWFSHLHAEPEIKLTEASHKEDRRADCTQTHTCTCTLTLGHDYQHTFTHRHTNTHTLDKHKDGPCLLGLRAQHWYTAIQILNIHSYYKHLQAPGKHTIMLLYFLEIHSVWKCCASAPDDSGNGHCFSNQERLNGRRA